jgi:dolichol-phosphate mannosyltransferase
VDTEKQKTIAIVIPVFNEQANIVALCDRIEKVIAGLAEYRWSLIFVDDGSSDATVDRLKEQIDRGLPISIIRFSRNFGHQAAIKAGMDHAQADAVITMDGDGQHPPEFIPKLIEIWLHGYQVVQTVRAPVQTGLSWWHRTRVRWAYRIINYFADRPVPSECADFRLIDRKVLDHLRTLSEVGPMLRGLVAWVGFKQTTIEYVLENRMNGQSRYSLRQMFGLMAGGVFDLSRKPLGLATTGGLGLIGVAFLARIFGIVGGLVFWIFLMAAIELLAIGLIGVYLGRAYNQVLDRPMYIISETVNFSDSSIQHS